MYHYDLSLPKNMTITFLYYYKVGLPFKRVVSNMGLNCRRGPLKDHLATKGCPGFVVAFIT